MQECTYNITMIASRQEMAKLRAKTITQYVDSLSEDSPL